MSSPVRPLHRPCGNSSPTHNPYRTTAHRQRKATMVGTNVCRVCESSAKSGHGFPSHAARKPTVQVRVRSGGDCVTSAVHLCVLTVLSRSATSARGEGQRLPIYPTALLRRERVNNTF